MFANKTAHMVLKDSKFGPITVSSSFISSSHYFHKINLIMKKHWWCDWDSSPGPQDWAIAAPKFKIGLFKQTLQSLQQMHVKKCYDHPVYGAGIRTHDLRNTSLLP